MPTHWVVIYVIVLTSSPSGAITLETGDFVSEIERLRNLAFASGSNLYVPPTVNEQENFSTLAAALLAGDTSAADTQAAALAYELVEYTDSASGAVYLGLREQLVGGETTLGWGSFFVAPTFLAEVLIEVPHPLNDTNTWDIAAIAFRETRSRGFLMAGAHRNANGLGTADVARLTDSIFHAVHTVWNGATAERPAWQIHGFDKDNHSFPVGTDVVLSNGDGGVTQEIVDLDGLMDDAGFPSYANNTLEADDPLNVQVNGAVDGITFSSLAATTNDQGIYSRSLGGIFVHVELERRVRFDEANRNLAASLISQAISLPEPSPALQTFSAVICLVLLGENRKLAGRRQRCRM